MQRKEQAEVAQSALHGVFTLPGAGGQRQSRTIALGNLYEAAKISPLAVSPKNFQGAPWPKAPLIVQANSFIEISESTRACLYSVELDPSAASHVSVYRAQLRCL